MRKASMMMWIGSALLLTTGMASAQDSAPTCQGLPAGHQECVDVEATGPGVLVCGTAHCADFGVPEEPHYGPTGYACANLEGSGSCVYLDPNNGPSQPRFCVFNQTVLEVGQCHSVGSLSELPGYDQLGPDTLISSDGLIRQVPRWMEPTRLCQLPRRTPPQGPWGPRPPRTSTHSSCSGS